MKFYCIALIIFLIIINCKSPTESTYNSNNLTGVVLSESGTPLNDAIIKLTYYLEYGDVSNEANIVM